MARRRDKLELLKDNELPGKDVFNALVNYLRHSDSSSPVLSINPNADGVGVNFSISKDALEDLLGAGILNTFRAYMAKDEGETKMSFNLTTGSVRHQLGYINIPQYKDTSPADKRKYWIKCVGSSAGSIQYGQDWPLSLVGGANYTELYLPICIIEGNDLAGWKITYHHIGDYILHNLPYTWIPGFDAAKAQSLDHNPGGQVLWNNYEECT